MEVLTSKTWWGKLGGYFSIGPMCGAFAPRMCACQDIFK